MVFQTVFCFFFNWGNLSRPAGNTDDVTRKHNKQFSQRKKKSKFKVFFEGKIFVFLR